jgi:hypothetical protein
MAHLSILVAEFGEDVPYIGGLARGFPFRGTRVPFLNRQKGIYRAAAQSGPAALAIQTSANSPYDDQILADGFDYAYRAGSIDQPDNRALRAAHELQVPLVYFIGTRPGWYKPVFPCYVREDRSSAADGDHHPWGAARPDRRARTGAVRGSDRAPVRRSAKRVSACIRPDSAGASSRRTAVSARSVGSRSFACSMRHTLSAT